MTGYKSPNRNSGLSKPAGPTSVQRMADSTQTIDILAVFPEDITTSGSYDLTRANLASFSRFLQALSVPTLLVAASHAIVFVNDAFVRIAGSGLDPAQLTFSSLFGTPKQAREAQLLLERVFTERRPAARETTLQIQGTRIWGRVHMRTLRVGKDQLVLVQIENLTAQKQLLTAKKYKKLVTVFPIGIAEFLLRTPLPLTSPPEKCIEAILRARMVDGNNEFARMYRRASIKQLLGVSMGKLLPSQGNARVVYEKWIEDYFRVSSFESRSHSSTEGTQRFEDALIATIVNEQLLGLWWLKKDVTEKRRMEDEIIKGQKLESLGILAGGIAHDFNNLLTAIMGNISFARRYLEPEGKACERIEAAAKAAARAQGLTRQLLTFSKGGEPIKRLGSVSELLKDCTTFALRGSNVYSQFRIPPDLWNVEMDETQVAQVIHNLVINAIQAMQQGGTVRIRAENVVVPEGNRFPLRHGRYVKVAVGDEGVGIPREHIRKVFDPYFTTKAGGTGLGLATAYSVIKKHGGLITVDSRPGKGTTFYFFLPAVLAKADSTNHDKQETRQGMGRVLVMDDEESIRDLSKELLQVCGYKVAVARHGMEALRIYKEAMKAGRPFDAVIMDLTIPGGMGGKETLRELLTFDPKAKAIVSSGYFNDPLMSDYERFGFKGVLPKPYDAGQITVVLEKVLRPNRG